MTKVIVALCAVLLGPPALAKRLAPPEAPAVHFRGVVYTASAEPDKMGIVEALNEVTGKILWEKQIYRVSMNPLLESDVQWVFIREMKIAGDNLLITNERGKCFVLDLKTREVREVSHD